MYDTKSIIKYKILEKLKSCRFKTKTTNLQP